MLSVDWQLVSFDVLDSTNAYVVNEARHGAPEGLVVRSDFQLAGKGRGDRVWESPPGAGLLCSVLLRPPLDDRHLQLSVMAVALALRAALQGVTGVAPSLKWPNDVLVGGQKVAGILAELVTTAAGPAVVVGVGCNLLAHPPLPTATDVAAATGQIVASADLLEALLAELAPRRAQLETPTGWAGLRQEYEGVSATLGRRVRVETPTGTVHGSAVAIDETGALVVESDGQRTTFRVGDVVHLRGEETT